MDYDYEGLKPGLYIRAGGGVKHITTFEDLMLSAGGRNPSAESLAAEVAWLWIALNKRKSHILEIPYTWQLRDNEQEETPYNIRFTELLQQTDEAMQLVGQAFWLKQRTGRRIVGMRWLDPTSIEPDYDTADPVDGVQRFKRHLDSGQWIWLDAADVVWFRMPGMREMRPGVPAGKASRVAADILRGMQLATETLYDNNALPVMLIKVPTATDPVELGRIENAFRRLFNQHKDTREVRTRGVRSDIEVVPLSMNPKDLEQGETWDRQRDTVLAAMDVPKSIAMSDASNYATATSDLRQFIGSLGGRFQYVADTLNDDADLMRDGWVLSVQVAGHWSMKEDEAQRAGAFGQYVSGGFTAEAAAYLLGISREDFPEDMVIFVDDIEEPEPEPIMVPVPEPPIVDERQEEEVRRLRAFVRNGKHLKRPFQSDILTQAQIAAIVEEESDNDMTAQFNEALARFNRAIE